MVEIAKNVGQKVTCKVLTQYTKCIFSQSELQPASSGPNKCIDLLSGEDFDPVDPSCTSKLVKSCNEELLFSESGQDNTLNYPVFSPVNLSGRTFPMDSDDSGHRHCTCIAQLLDEHVEKNSMDHNLINISSKCPSITIGSKNW